MLARELGMHVRQMLATLTSSEITEQMAATALQNTEWREELAEEIEDERLASMPQPERIKLQKAILRGRA